MQTQRNGRNKRNSVYFFELSERVKDEGIELWMRGNNFEANKKLKESAKIYQHAWDLKEKELSKGLKK